MRDIRNRNVVVFYSNATCNLNCRYCYIDKNKFLKDIDDILDESFQGDYYIDFCKEVFSDPAQLKRVEVWGGEPFLRMDRVHYTLRKVIENYPNFEEFFTSTNFVSDVFVAQFRALLAVFGEYADRSFKFHLQISLDGTKEITDESRGAGVTDKLIRNFDYVCAHMDELLPSNVDLTFTFKPTLDAKSIRLLQSKEKIIEYYQFFEWMYDKTHVSQSDGCNFHMGITVPNTACPSPHTKEDGILFANHCRLCREIERQPNFGDLFHNYKTITPFENDTKSYECQRSYKLRGGTCGSGRYMVGLLPFKKISCCHMSFVDIVSGYKDAATANAASKQDLDFRFFLNTQPSQLCMDVADFPQYESKIDLYYRPNSKSKLATIASEIQVEAFVGNIDAQYKDSGKALEAAIFLNNNTSYCVRDNWNVTGSINVYPVGLIRLLLNGAKEAIENEQ